MKVSVSLAPLLLVWLTTGSPLAAQSADSLGAWTIVRAAGAPLTATLRSRGAERYLGIRCDTGRTYAFVAWDAPLGPSPRIAYRVDAEDPLESVWNSSANGDAAFFPGRTIEFVSRLAEYDSLSTVVTSANDSIATVFDLQGIDAALLPIREACRW